MPHHMRGVLSADRWCDCKMFECVEQVRGAQSVWYWMRNHHIYMESTYSRTIGNPVHSNMIKKRGNLIEIHLVIFIQAFPSRSKLFTFDYTALPSWSSSEDRGRILKYKIIIYQMYSNVMTKNVLWITFLGNYFSFTAADLLTRIINTGWRHCTVWYRIYIDVICNIPLVLKFISWLRTTKPCTNILQMNIYNPMFFIFWISAHEKNSPLRPIIRIWKN